MIKTRGANISIDGSHIHTPWQKDACVNALGSVADACACARECVHIEHTHIMHCSSLDPYVITPEHNSSGGPQTSLVQRVKDSAKPSNNNGRRGLVWYFLKNQPKTTRQLKANVDVLPFERIPTGVVCDALSSRSRP